MQNPMISIITASYNYEKYIEETIESVLKQTYSNWEMIIVDDGSSDNSIEYINKYCNKDSRIKLFTHENNSNKGLCETLKLGIKNANGEYIVFLESDDYIERTYLTKKMEFFNSNPDIYFAYNKIKPIGEKNDISRIEGYLSKINKYWLKYNKPHYLSNNLHFWNLVPTFSCVMLKASLLDNCNFNSPKPAWLDWWLWAQISSHTKFYCLQDELTYWRIHATSYTCRDVITPQYYEDRIRFFLALNKILPPLNGISNKIKFTIKQMLRTVKYAILINMKGRKINDK